MILEILEEYKNNPTDQVKKKTLSTICQVFCGPLIDYVDSNDEKIKEIVFKTANRLIEEKNSKIYK